MMPIFFFFSRLVLLQLLISSTFFLALSEDVSMTERLVTSFAKGKEYLGNEHEAAPAGF